LDKVLKEKETEYKASLMLIPSYCKHRNEKYELLSSTVYFVYDPKQDLQSPCLSFTIYKM